jgi:CRP-like cAMP-binding protein
MRHTAPGAFDLNGNRLVEELPFEERSRLVSRCNLLALEAGRVIAEPNKAIHHVYFPYTASISVSATDGNSRCIEGLLIGNEGMFGLPVALGTDTWPLGARVQCGGHSLRMPTDEFKDIHADSPALRRTLMRYSLITLSQLARSIACTSFHSIESRLARWMLMTQDRTCSDSFSITMKFFPRYLACVVQASALRPLR